MRAWLLEIASAVALIVGGLGVWALPTSTLVVGRPPVAVGWILIGLGILVFLGSTGARLDLRLQMPIRRGWPPKSPEAPDGLRAAQAREVLRIARGDQPTSGAEKLRAELADNVDAVREFYAEVEKIAGPNPAATATQKKEAELDITAEIDRLIRPYFRNVPLREAEWANLTDLLEWFGLHPNDQSWLQGLWGTEELLPRQPGQPQRWHLPLPMLGDDYHPEDIRSDETLETLGLIYNTLTDDLIPEVRRWNYWHTVLPEPRL
jgi:hypothetical protein